VFDLGSDEVINLFKSKVDDIKQNMGVIMDLGNKNMKPRHWKKVFEEINQV
jgi:hypothetical protein